MIELLGIPFFFILEPIFNIKEKVPVGYEVLCRSLREKIDNEVFFSALSIADLEMLFMTQAEFFIDMCAVYPQLKRNIFINIPAESLLRKSFRREISLLSYHTAINLEVQYSNDLKIPGNVSFESQSQNHPIRIWIDDVNTIEAVFSINKRNLGIKLDKHAFWQAFKDGKSLASSSLFNSVDIIVEGVETAEHIKHVRDSHLSLCQGYYWPSISPTVFVTKPSGCRSLFS